MKKILSFALLVTMLASILAGCGGDDKTPSNSEATPTVTEERDISLENYQISLENNLTNPNATDAAKAVYNFICDMSGKYIISGQQEGTNAGGTEFNDIFAAAGKTAVLKGLDFINGDYEGVTRRAKLWWESGGLVSICWHMGTPPNGDAGYDSSKGNFNLTAALTEGTDENKALMAEFDKAVPYLKELQDAGVPVLWRPFHEFDGGWFWWGKSGSEAFIELWRLMYDYYTNEQGLNNLIWVCGFSASIAQHTDWYPGHEYVDIVGADIYAKTDGSQSGLYTYCANVAGDSGKPICLHENGIIPNPDKLKEDGVHWSWFMTWHSEWLEGNGDDYIKQVYNHEYVIAMDRMPKLKQLIDAASK